MRPAFVAIACSLIVSLALWLRLSGGASIAATPSPTIAAPAAVATLTTPHAAVKGTHPRRAEGATAAGAAAAPAVTLLQDIASSGPLQHIFVGDDLSCQVALQGDADFEFYPPDQTLADCGTFAVVNNVLFGPDLFSRGSAAGSLGNFTAYTPISQSGVSGSGTAGSPFSVITVVGLGDTGITLTETDSYVVGATSYRTDLAVSATGSIANSGLVFANVRLYRAADCYMGNSDVGFGVTAPANGIGCAKTANDQPPNRAVRFEPLTPAQGYYESFYAAVWTQLGAKTALPDTCDCDRSEDNGAAISWAFSLPYPPGNPPAFSERTDFGASGTTAIHCAFSDPACSATGTPVPNPAHVQYAAVVRAPVPPFAPHVEADNVIFTGDDAAGLGVKIGDVNLNDAWTFNYWTPGHDPGSVPADYTCTMKIMAPADPQNPSGVTALVAENCPGPAPVALDVSFGAGCPCSPPDVWSLAPAIAGNAAANLPGTWQATLDFTDGPTGVMTPGLAAASFELRPTPLVVLVHGWLSDCGAMNTLREQIGNDLEIDAARFPCFTEPGRNGYDYDEGVQLAGCHLREWLNGASASDPGAPVDIVAHSMGGLLARYAANPPPGDPCPAATLDVPLHSISMLGTPNGGVQIAALPDEICQNVAALVPGLIRGAAYAACLKTTHKFIQDEINVHLDSTSIHDLAPNSELLNSLNGGFVVPASPIYRALAGSKTDLAGFVTSSDMNNDCFVSVKSVLGPEGLFAFVASTYNNVNHTSKLFDLPGVPCGEPNLRDDDLVSSDVASDIKSEPGVGGGGGGGSAAAAAPAAETAAPAPALLAESGGVVQHGQQDTHVLSMPAGVSSAAFVVEWLDSDTPPVLTVTLQRPDGRVVAVGDPDVATPITITGDSALFAQVSGFAINAPAAGDWTVTVTGATVPADGQPYLVEVEPDSQVGVAVTRTSDRLPQGSPEVVTAELSDTGAAIAPSALDAQLVQPDGSLQPLTLVDDGTNGDATAGDGVFSATISATAACGTYGVDVTATGNSSEGVVTRLGSTTFDMQVPGDAVGDPCNADDDADGLSDQAEISQYHTDPQLADSDTDGLADGAEVNTYGTDPLNRDTDGDGLADGDEVTIGTNPLVPDTDGDTLTDGEEIIRGTNPLLADTDGDGLTDPYEITVTDTNPVVADTDGDGLSDGAEWNTYGTNPIVADTDGDGLSDGDEVNIYATDPLAADTDGDGITDGAEVIRGTNPLLPDTIAEAHIVTVADFSFTDAASGTATTTVHTGDTVTWDWTAGTHSVCSGNTCSPVTSPANTTDPWASGTFTAPMSFSHVFNTPGTYTYECEVHPAQMTGTVVVLPAASVGGIAEAPDIGSIAASGGNDATPVEFAAGMALVIAASGGVLVWRRRRAAR